MRLLKSITDSDFLGGETEFLNKVSRYASRGTLINEDGQVAMMEMAANHLYKLPGGGMEKDECPESTFLREIKEETGYDARIIHVLGYIDEHKARNQYLHRSYCYIAKAISLQGPASLTENEQRLGMQMNWMSLDEAIARLQHGVGSDGDFSMRFMLLRDLTILKLTSQWINEGGGLKNDG